jgi:hypothetical protein
MRLDEVGLTVIVVRFSPKVFAGLLKFLVLALPFGVDRN